MPFFLLSIAVIHEIVIHHGRCAGLGMLFAKDAYCHFEQGTCADDYSVKHGTHLTCARTCLNNYQCAAFSFQTTDVGLLCACTLYDVSSCYDVKDDDVISTGEEVFIKRYGVCLNGGQWMEDVERCSCQNAGGLVGPYCTSRAVVCHDYLLAGYTRGFINMNPFGEVNRVQIQCYNQPSRGYSVSLFAGLNRPHWDDFNRGWEEFENGFQNRGNVWIGLAAMRFHLETFRDRSTSLTVMFQSDAGDLFIFSYDDFRIGDSSEGYKMSFSTSSLWTSGLTDVEAAEVPQCLREANGSRFSTFDHDNDGDDENNCALLSRTGFWYNSCHPPCHPLARSFNQTAEQMFNATAVRTDGNMMSFSDPFLWGGNFIGMRIQLTVYANSNEMPLGPS